MSVASRLVAGLSLLLVVGVVLGAVGSLVRSLTTVGAFQVPAVVTTGLVVLAVAAGTLLGVRSVPLSTRYW